MPAPTCRRAGLTRDGQQRRDFIDKTLKTIAAAPLIGTASAASAASPAGVYDYVVIGAGSSGSVLVRRLIDAGHKVLVLEAGPTDSLPAIHEPPSVMQLYHSEVDWAFTTQPQHHAADQRIDWPRGKTLGGSSAINGMVYVRGLPQDFDGWAERGAAGWAWRDVEPYFRKLERFRLDDPLHAHGHDGLLDIGRPTMTPLARDFVAAATELGLPDRGDYNDGRDSTGAALSQFTILPDGRRASAWTCYVEPIKTHPRLTIVTQARVLNLLLNGHHAFGVRFLLRGETIAVRAEREVLLCAGSIMSPALLMHSGIGPAADLERVGIRPAVDLPGVGANLHDHAACSMVWETTRENARSFTTGMEATVFMRTDASLATPDAQILLSTSPFLPTVKRGFTLVPMAIAPRSRGRVRLTSADPLVYPSMDPRVFADPHDLEVVAKQALFIRDVATRPSLSAWGAREVTPGPSVSTLAAMIDYAKQSAATGYHQVGTARMGVDAMAVVDPQLKVRGVSGLRVIDASVMPAVTSGNTNGPAMMIAEKAADMLLGIGRSRGQ
ncbi:GMC family oxidoreductase [Burkholderia mayonis]|uniref:Choline dehydrogenase n=1 Tax=Burkholderia mayonis TaxID=1385591 RepID=A0A1B4FR09_9BURK|nr:GMC family oxidoreductase N-terminal domain-containing protein [Burkholderia mayonis]AOJ06099.1 choline dehydrogenase [Burkholderia mayonis]KVE56834.1 choline dehydrogenase [Burkholderia mayonis]